MKKSVIILSALALFAAMSCNKAEVQAQRSEKHPVTLTVGLGAQTRISHEYGDLGDGKVGIKTQWEDGDKVFVQYNGSTEVFDVVDIAEDGKSAEFYKEDSTLPDGASFTVIYATPGFLKTSDDPLTFKIQNQTGVLENLPEYLVAENCELGNSCVLESKLIYFHFVLNKAVDSESTLTEVTQVTFGSKAGASWIMGAWNYDPKGGAGTIKITPASSALTVDGNEMITKIDMYVAVFNRTQQKAYGLSIGGSAFLPGFGGTGDGDTGSGGTTSQTLKFFWDRNDKTYLPGHVYYKSWDF